MKNSKISIFSLMALIVLCSGCINEKEKHKVMPNGAERGIKIEIMLKNGGTAELICPRFDYKPLGSHGRECYLESYDK